MKNSILRTWLSAVAALCLSSMAMAEGMYAGVGYSDTTYEGAGKDYSATGFAVYGGQAVNDLIAIEVSYNDFGKLDFSDGENGRATSYGVAGVLGHDMESVHLFAKLGAHSWDYRFDDSAGTTRFKATNTDLFYGIGVSMALAEQWSARAEYELYKLGFDSGTLDIVRFGAGVTYHF